MRYSPQKNFEEAIIADIYMSKVQNIVLEAKWREPENLAKIVKKTFDVDLQGDNLATTKQIIGHSLKNKPATSPITKRVEKIRADKEKERIPLDDDDRKRFRDEEFLRNNTHGKLIKRYGQEQPSNLEDDKIGDRLYRGQISGGDPWKDGTYGGAFHYAHPVKGDTRKYSGTSTAALQSVAVRPNSRHAVGSADNNFHVTHHYRNHPDQLYGRSHSSEDVLTGTSEHKRREQAAQLQNRSTGSAGRHLETPITQKHNPFIGTELSDDYGAKSYFFPAGKPAKAAQNYAREMSKTISSKDGKVEVGKSKGNITITPQNLSGAARNQPERLKELEKKSPEKFSEFMRRRYEKYLSPRQK